MIRLFVGVSLPVEVRDYLLGLQTGIRSARWQRDDQLHLSLKFIGEVEEPVAHDLAVALADIRMAPFALALDGAGLFGSMTAPRTLWAGVSPVDEVTRLRDKVEMAAVRIGLPVERRKFMPHVTLARMPGRRSAESGLATFFEAYGALKTPSFMVEDFALFRSQLSRDGSVYHIEEHYPLAGI